MSEVKAVLAAEGYECRILEKLDQVLRMEADADCVYAIRDRAAFTRLLMQELFICEAEVSAIVRAISTVNLGASVCEGESFAVRVRHVKDHSSSIDGMALERTLGDAVLKGTSKTSVDLRNPDRVFVGVLTDERFIFGLKVAEILAKPFVERRPRKKPFFHPSAMQAKLARCMVNLAVPKRGDILIDPFCGTGSILIEGGLIGCRVLGFDVQRRMARGTLRNLSHFGVRAEGVVVADARKLPMTKVDCIVTDPPYGRSATTLKSTTKDIVNAVLSTTSVLLARGKRICIAAPKTLNIGEMGVELGYRHLESHFVYVHRTLTREVAVFEKV